MDTNTVKVTHYLSEDGEAMVSVPLTNTNQQVSLYQETFNSLIEKGLDPRWMLSNGQILERGTRLSVTRLVANIGKGEKVQLFDGNPCNLKQDNFVIGKGGGKYRAMDKLLSPERTHKFKNKATLEHKYIEPDWMKNNEYKQNN
jgi:hypothetical protein